PAQLGKNTLSSLAGTVREYLPAGYRRTSGLGRYPNRPRALNEFTRILGGKIMPPRTTSSDDLLRRFESLAETYARLSQALAQAARDVESGSLPDASLL